MMDITHVLESFRASKPSWRLASSHKLATDIADKLDGRLDWDGDAGESWARVFLGPQSVAMIFMEGPLLMLAESASEQVAAAAGETPVIIVPSFDVGVLTCDRQTLRDVFGVRVWNNPALDVRHFSADELWFTTV
jgi:hypothetical protein